MSSLLFSASDKYSSTREQSPGVSLKKMNIKRHISFVQGTTANEGYKLMKEHCLPRGKSLNRWAREECFHQNSPEISLHFTTPPMVAGRNVGSFPRLPAEIRLIYLPIQPKAKRYTFKLRRRDITSR